jgi:excisionase family DNA binding protein
VLGRRCSHDFFLFGTWFWFDNWFQRQGAVFGRLLHKGVQRVRGVPFVLDKQIASISIAGKVALTAPAIARRKLAAFLPSWATVEAIIVSKSKTTDTQLTVRQVARRLNVQMTYVYTLLWSGKLAGKKIGGHWYTPESVVADYEQRKTSKLNLKRSL